MAFSHSMWLSRRSIVVVLVVLMPFLWSAEAMPREDCSAGGGTNAGSGIDFASVITERTLVTGRAQCVKFHQCCDKIKKDPDIKEELPFLGLVDERTGNAIINIDSSAGGNQKCGGLNLCCRCVNTTLTTPDPELKNPTCGKRNKDGVKISVTGFKEGQTQQGEFPWMVAVLNKSETYIAGGSLVHPRVVLTAGHKVYKETYDSVMVRVGDWDIDNQIESITPQIIEVEQILYHHNFNRSRLFYDVAILILKAEAKYGETVAPVCLPQPGQNFDEKNCFVTGWGRDEMGTYPSIMKVVSVPIVEHNECQASYQKTALGSNFVLDRSFICAGGHNADACDGDGGSPLVCPGATNPKELVQVGVVSWGIGCRVEGRPGVYGSVPESMYWINDIIDGIIDDRSLR